MWVSLVSLLPLVAFAFALPSQDCEHKVKEERGWTIFGPAPPDHLIKLRIGLPQSNFDVLEEHLHAISDPYHERLPKDILDHVELIQPTTMFGTFKKLRSTIHSISEIDPHIQAQNLPPVFDSATGLTVDASCNTTITITCLQQIYNAVGYTPADLQTFFADQVPAAAAVNATYNFVSVVGGLDPQDPAEAGGESNLDTQFAFGLSFPVASTYFSTADRPPFIPDIGTPEDTNEPYTDVSSVCIAQRSRGMVSKVQRMDW
ncbi:hypothetical protein C8J57DRAFT_1634672 [Mycena rebaudengoi]|nr:hypothetical protein C8J57DRAFT_1634672 [Mycena rebaudengoi]